MSYDSLLVTISGKRSIWLYEFILDGVTYRFNPTGSDYMDGDGVTWTAKNLSHSRFRLSLNLSRMGLSIYFPQSDTFAQLYENDVSYLSNSVIIYHEFRNQSPSARAIKFRGRVIGSKPNLVGGSKQSITRRVLVAENNLSKMRRKAQSAVMQRPCRHALYHTSANGYGCGLTIEAFEVAATATAFSSLSRVITVTEASAQADGYYSGGVITWDDKRQYIVAHEGTSLTLLAGIQGLADALGSGAQGVAIAPGCNKTRSVCLNRFDNLDNFGGFPWMDETPFDGKILY